MIDRVKKDRSNMQEVLSDTVRTLSDFRIQIEQPAYGWEISFSESTPVYEEYMEDEVAGWETTFTITQPFINDVCAIPFIVPPTPTNGWTAGGGNTDWPNYVPTSRTLTINGTTYDLSADRSWTVSAGAGTWGSITGTLSNQTDLQSALDGKQSIDADLTSWAAITRASGFDTFTAAPTSANLAALITDETGTGKFVLNTSPTFETSVLMNYSTASTIASFDGSKNLTSLNTATYPSLTELTYVKGVTSAIQTQLDAKIFVVKMLINSGLTPADGTTYYFGCVLTGLTTVAASKQFKIPYDCTLIGASINSTNNTTNATSESSTISIRKNNTTDLILSSAVSFGGVAPVTNQTVVTGLSTAYVANDLIEGKWLTPTWVTNPTAVSLAIDLYFIS
jgi:hypothetical protein